MMESLTQWAIPEWDLAQTIGMMAFIIGASAFLHSDGRRFRLHLMLFFIAMLWVMGMPQLEHYYEILTIFGPSVATYALFKMQGVGMRLLVMFNSFCWDQLAEP